MLIALPCAKRRQTVFAWRMTMFIIDKSYQRPTQTSAIPGDVVVFVVDVVVGNHDEYTNVGHRMR